MPQCQIKPQFERTIQMSKKLLTVHQKPPPNTSPESSRFRYPSNSSNNSAVSAGFATQAVVHDFLYHQSPSSPGQYGLEIISTQGHKLIAHVQCISSPDLNVIIDDCGVLEVSLKHRDSERFIADVDPDVTSAVETAKWDFLGDGMVRSRSLCRDHDFFKAFSCQSRLIRNQAYVNKETSQNHYPQLLVSAQFELANASTQRTLVIPVPQCQEVV